ncbi:hypothetical protein W02_18440 [Nitrospira sp. KM1]|uniref:hypothetical protein n=1 Tax=Nitrospira sp. KM1 TaxID=1936990 RepID=UPI0013A7154F|nr:hypothetical protein [Nitrospira sp. KM1]BCA54704.1 hypothetical protein W02_18440 [Nitrospira sp. KM1]
MTNRRAVLHALAFILGCLLPAISGYAQTTPTLTPPQTVPLTQQSTTQTDAANAANPASGTPAPTVAPGTGNAASSSVGKSFGTAGRGLPGMPGGPPLTGTLGGQDPSSQYMRPPTLPPVLCDPAVEIPC